MTETKRKAKRKKVGRPKGSGAKPPAERHRHLTTTIPPQVYAYLERIGPGGRASSALRAVAVAAFERDSGGFSTAENATIPGVS